MDIIIYIWKEVQVKLSFDNLWTKEEIFLKVGNVLERETGYMNFLF